MTQVTFTAENLARDFGTWDADCPALPLVRTFYEVLTTTSDGYVLAAFDRWKSLNAELSGRDPDDLSSEMHERVVTK